MQDVSRQVLVHCQWEFPDFCSLSLGVPLFLFIATGSSLIFVHCHWEFPRLDVCRVIVKGRERPGRDALRMERFLNTIQAEKDNAIVTLIINVNLVKPELAPKLLKLYSSDFHSVLGAALQQNVALIF